MSSSLSAAAAVPSAHKRFLLPRVTSSRRLPVTALRPVLRAEGAKRLAVRAEEGKGPISSSSGPCISKDAALRRFWAAAARVTAGAAAASLSLAMLAAPPPSADAIPIFRFPAAEKEEVFRVQQTMVQAWNIVSQTYVDPEFNGHNWLEELSKGMLTTYKADDADSAYNTIEDMLSDLGDPYTRISRPREFANFRMSTDGELEGVGMLVASLDGKLVVVAPFKDSPAQRAGIQPGDELLSINGKSIAGFNGEEVARLLRGKAGTSVSVRLHRRTSSTPGVAARPDQMPIVTTRQVRMRREAVELSSVYSKMLVAEEGAPSVGYISLANFSQHVARDVASAIKDLEQQGASSYILDLRDNGGGLVDAGMDVARLWLDGPANVFHVKGRMDENVQDINLPDGHSLTTRPLAVLVNKNSASASEILAGALHDHGRASIIGDSPTFGKGKIQSVYELQDGSALFVTIAKYTTPQFHEIDQVGINPDYSCSQPFAQTASATKPRIPNSSSLASILTETEDDACVKSARSFLSHLPRRDA